MATDTEFRGLRSGRVVPLARSPCDSGGEGGLYEVLGDASRLAKVYATPCRLDDVRGQRVVALAERDDNPHLVRVEEVLVSVGDPGEVCGCLMKKEFGPTLFSVTDPVERRHLRIALAFPDRVRLALELARAVEALHRSETVQADAHPRNVIVRFDRHGRVAGTVLIDAEAWLFELRDEVGRMLNLVTTTLLPEAMAPELHGVDLTQNRPDKRSDVFALALMMSYALFDCPPQAFAGSKLTMVEQIVRGFDWITPNLPPGATPPAGLPVDPATVPGDVTALLRRGLSSAPDDRPAAGEFVAALDAWHRRVCLNTAAGRYMSALAALWKARSVVAVFGRAADAFFAALRHHAPETAAKPARWWVALAVKCLGPVVLVAVAALWAAGSRSAKPPPVATPLEKKAAADAWRTPVGKNDPDPE